MYTSSIAEEELHYMPRGRYSKVSCDEVGYADSVSCERPAANAWEEEDEVVLVACRSPSIDLEGVSVYLKQKPFINEL